MGHPVPLILYNLWYLRYLTASGETERPEKDEAVCGSNAAGKRELGADAPSVSTRPLPAATEHCEGVHRRPQHERQPSVGRHPGANQVICSSKEEYRVTLVVEYLGWVDLDLGCYTILLGQ